MRLNSEQIEAVLATQRNKNPNKLRISEIEQQLDQLRLEKSRLLTKNEKTENLCLYLARYVEFEKIAEKHSNKELVMQVAVKVLCYADLSMENEILIEECIRRLGYHPDELENKII